MPNHARERAAQPEAQRPATHIEIRTTDDNMYFVLSALLLLSSDFVRQFLEEVIGAQFVPYLVDSPVAFIFALLVFAKCVYALKNLACGSRSKNGDAEQYFTKAHAGNWGIYKRGSAGLGNNRTGSEGNGDGL